MKFKRLKIAGLKGSEVEVDLDEMTLVQGPNAAGKSRIGNAIGFLLGRDVEGRSAEGGMMRGALCGDLMRVEAVVEVGGSERVVARSRAVSGDVFSRSKVDGEIPDLPAPDDWADASADRIGQIVARVGARITGVAEAGDSDPVEYLASRRAAAREALNSAAATIRGLRASAGESLKRRPEVAPDAVPKATAAVERAQADLVRARAAAASAASVERLAEIEAELREAGALDVDLGDRITAAEKYRVDMDAELRVARESESAARRGLGASDAHVTALRSLVGDGVCPTCKRPHENAEELSAALAEAEEARRVVKVELAGASAYVEDARTELEHAAAEVESLKRLVWLSGERDRLRALDIDADALPVESAEDVLRVANAEATRLIREKEQADRWQRDREALEAAEEKKREAEATLDKVVALERKLVDSGWAWIEAHALVPDWMGSVALRDGRVGLLRDGVFWFGPGLSGAEAVTLNLTLDIAAAKAAGGEPPVVIVEADALDNLTLDRVRGALDMMVFEGVIGQAIVVTWIERDPAGWKVVRPGVEPEPSEPEPEPEDDPDPVDEIAAALGEEDDDGGDDGDERPDPVRPVEIKALIKDKGFPRVGVDALRAALREARNDPKAGDGLTRPGVLSALLKTWADDGWTHTDAVDALREHAEANPPRRVGRGAAGDE